MPCEGRVGCAGDPADGVGDVVAGGDHAAVRRPVAGGAGARRGQRAAGQGDVLAGAAHYGRRRLGRGLHADDPDVHIRARRAAEIGVGLHRGAVGARACGYVGQRQGAAGADCGGAAELRPRNGLVAGVADADGGGVVCAAEEDVLAAGHRGGAVLEVVHLLFHARAFLDCPDHYRLGALLEPAHRDRGACFVGGHGASGAAKRPVLLRRPVYGGRGEGDGAAAADGVGVHVVLVEAAEPAHRDARAHGLGAGGGARANRHSVVAGGGEGDRRLRFADRCHVCRGHRHAVHRPRRGEFLVVRHSEGGVAAVAALGDGYLAQAGVVVDDLPVLVEDALSVAGSPVVVALGRGDGRGWVGIARRDAAAGPRPGEAGVRCGVELYRVLVAEGYRVLLHVGEVEYIEGYAGRGLTASPLYSEGVCVGVSVHNVGEVVVFFGCVLVKIHSGAASGRELHFRLATHRRILGGEHGRVVISQCRTVATEKTVADTTA